MSSRLYEQVEATRWAMHEPVLEQMLDVFANRERGVRLTEAEIDALTSPNAAQAIGRDGGESEGPGYTLDGSVAIVPIGGVLSKHSSLVSRMSKGQGTSVAEIRHALRGAESDARVNSIMLMIDSPGGSVAGISSVVDDVRRIRKGGTPVVAYADDMAASAAYWIASQADRIVAGRTTSVGSIGVYSVLRDTSKKHEKEGVTTHIVKAGKHKAAGVDGVPFDDEMLATVKSEIEDFYDAFVGDVAKGRKGVLSKSEVLELADGRVHLGEKAKAVGLVDEINTAEAVVARMNREHGRAEKRRPANRKAVTERAIAMDESNTVGDAQGTVGDQHIVQAAADAVSKAAGGPISIADVQAAATEAATNAVAEMGRLNAERTQAINAACAGFDDNIEVQRLRGEAIADPSCTVDAFRGKLLDAIRDGNQATGTIATGGQPNADRMAADVSLELLARTNPGLRSKMASGGAQAQEIALELGLDSSADFGKRLREVQGAGMRGYSMLDFARALTPGGGAMGRDDLISAAMGHSTSDFPLLMKDVTGKILLTSFMEEPTTYEQIARIGSASDFKSQDMITLSEGANLKEVIEGKTPEHVTLNERDEKIRLRTFGNRIDLTRQMMLNDDLAAFAAIPQMNGAAAARVPEDLVYIALNAAGSTEMSDGVNFFDSGTRGNLLTAAALGVSSLENAIEAMMLQKGFGKDKAELQIEPETLLVPTGLKFVAERIVGSAVRSNVGESAPGNASNEPNTVGFLRVVASNRLHRASPTAWYLLANTSRVPALQVNFLNGQRAPIVSEVGDGSLTKLTYETIFDCGAALVQPEGATKNAGA